MNATRVSRALAEIVMFVCVCLQFILPRYLAAQPLPQVFFITEYASSESHQMGPDSEWSEYFYYGHTSDNPLVVNSVRRVQRYSSPEESFTIDSTYVFNGSFEQCENYFISRSPGGMAVQDMQLVMIYRTSKISNDGYYFEDSYSYNLDNSDPLASACYSYNAEMKMTMAMYKYSSNLYYRIECEVDSLGRRVQDITSISADSLNWTPQYRKRYFYSGEPMIFDGDFEKHLTYPPAIDLRPSTSMPLYLNNDWEIQSVDYSSWYNGAWGSEYTWEPTLQVLNTGCYTYYYASYYSWDLNGLPLKINLPNGYETIGFSLVYSHTSHVNVEDEIIPQPQVLSIWPNPSKGQARIRLNKAEPANVSVKTFNLRGQLIKQEYYHHNPQSVNNFCWNAFDTKGSVLANGVYFIKLEWKGGSRTSRIVVWK